MGLHCNAFLVIPSLAQNHSQTKVPWRKRKYLKEKGSIIVLYIFLPSL